MKSPLISLILPIYNVENYLKQCLDSILNQDFKDIEIVLIDDGSPDNCGKLCDEYAKNDNRIVVFHKKNEGVSSARNDGIKLATGKYLWFVDPDDYISDNSLTIISEKMQNNPDIIFINAYLHHVENDKIEILDMNFKNLKFTDSNSLFKFFYDNKLKGYPWYKICKRDFILDNKLFFNNELNFAEDLEQTIRMFETAKTISACNESLYYYRVGRIGSAVSTNGINLKHFDSKIKICDIYYKTENKYIKSIISRLYYIALLEYSTLMSKNDRKKYKLQLKKHLYLLNYCNDSTVVKFKKMYGTLGMTLGFAFYKLFLKIRPN